MTMMTVRVGFDLREPEGDARLAAVREWHERVERDGKMVRGQPLTRVDYRDPQRLAVDEYVVVVTGEVE